MKKLLFLSLFICSMKCSYAQQFDEVRTADIMMKIPRSQTTSTSDISEYVKKNFAHNKEKAWAIYMWVISNIKYDTDSTNIFNLGTNTEAKVTEALRRKKGVCENYAAIFNDICLKSGLTSFIVDGYTKQNGEVDKMGHTWCAVSVENTWQLCDPTWDAGAGINTRFFMIPPSDMIASHMPYDPMWQLLDHTISNRQFYTGDLYARKDKPFFNYTDSINAYFKMDSLQRFRSSAYRIEQNGLYNDLVKGRFSNTKMNIEILRQDKDVDLYNSSVADLNDVAGIYNNFAEYRNKQFTPAKTDADLDAMLDGASSKILQAYKKLDEIDRSQATFTISTEPVRNKLIALEALVKEQKEFLAVYFNTAINNRLALFYNKQVTAAGK